MKTSGISYSSTFCKRTLCRYCKKGPSVYYSSYNIFVAKDYKDLKDVMLKYFDSFNPDQIRLSDPRTDLYMSDSSFRERNNFNVRHHKNIKYYNDNSAYNKIDISFCECSKTVWIFNLFHPENVRKIDILSRKSNKKFDIHF